MLRIVQDWKVEDRHVAAQFFGTPTGARFLESLRISRPALGGSTRDESASAGERAGGYEECFNNMAKIVGYDPTTQQGDALEFFDPNAVSNREINAGSGIH
jgi:hypothetical protein